MMNDSREPFAESSVTSVSERRRSIRHQPPIPSGPTVVARSDDKASAGRIMDISAGGIGMILDQPFAVGTMLEVQIKDPSAATTQDLSLRVAHCADQADGTWLIGGAFHTRPNGLDLLTLLT